MSRESAVEQLRASFEKRKYPPAPPLPDQKWASVQGFKTFFNIHSWAVSGALFADPDGYDQIHPVDLNDAELGAATRVALAASRMIRPGHPDYHALLAYFNREQSKVIEDRLKARAGVKTLKSLYSGAGNVSIQLMDGVLTLSPWRYAGNGIWEGIKGKETASPSTTMTDTDLGAAIRTALEVSKLA